MDEPTNHLDMRSKEMLIDSLENYDGTLLIVSHDRYFLDSLVNKVFEIKNGSVQVYLGTYAEYLEKAEKAWEEEKKQQTEAAAKQEAERKAAAAKPVVKKPAAPKANSKKIAAIEKEIQRLEESKKQHEAMMAQPSFYEQPAEATRKATAEYEELCKELDALYLCWEEEAG
jgi:ATP-binding cassette subfamily F protein 3